MNAVLRYNCIKTRRRLHQRLDGELPASQAPLLVAHLERCPACAAHAERLEAALGLLHAAAPVVAPARLPARIMAAARNASAPTPVARPALTLRLATAGAIMALMLVVGVTMRIHVPHGTAPAALPLASLPAPEAPVAALPEPATKTPEAAPVRIAAAPLTLTATEPALHRMPHGEEPPPAPPARHRPFASGAISGGSVIPADADRAESPTDLTMAHQRTTVAPTAQYATGEGAFTDQVVGGMVADAMLASYLDGAPRGIQISPAATEGGPQ
jgi:anti-sigma factor RsiW